ncbi:MAG: Transcription factor TFIIIB component B [Trizodia sp. TS-e1964]|nr:MAG: Transcription factor TFIIIB component B [Trizodia sp. TS-e1964]
MSTFGSSAINKSSKKLAPKLGPRRRPGAPVSTLSSTRASIERQDSSQTLPQTIPIPPPLPSSNISKDVIDRILPEIQAGVNNLPAQSISGKDAPPIPDLALVQTPGNIFQEPESLGLQLDIQGNGAKLNILSPIGSHHIGSHLLLSDSTINGAIVTEGNISSVINLVEQQAAQGPVLQPSPKRRRTDNYNLPGTLITNPTPRTHGEPYPAVDGGASVTFPPLPDAATPAPASPRTHHELPKRGTHARRGQRAKVTRSKSQKLPKTGTRRSKRNRESTPEDAENFKIAPAVVKMSELCKELRTGKKSQRSVEIEKIETEAARKRQELREREELGELDEQQVDIAETVDERLERAAREQENANRSLMVPQTRMVNGQIVLDDQSLQLDRHANAAVNAEEMEQVEENELSRRITSQTWMRREKTVAWTEDLLDRLYQGLRMFGTDFEIISKMFPGRTRKQIKLRFNLEEKRDPARINEALVGPKLPMNLEEFSKISKTTYEDPEIFKKELKDSLDAHNAEQARQEKEAEESRKRKRIENGAETIDGVTENSSTKDNEAAGATASVAPGKAGKRGKTSSKKKKKNLHSRLGGGEEVEVLGTIDEVRRERADELD